MHETPLQVIDIGVCDLINSHDGLWRKVGELTRTKEYVLITDPYKKLLRQLDVIEETIGVTERTKQLKHRAVSLSPA